MSLSNATRLLLSRLRDLDLDNDKGTETLISVVENELDLDHRRRYAVRSDQMGKGLYCVVDTDGKPFPRTVERRLHGTYAENLSKALNQGTIELGAQGYCPVAVCKLALRLDGARAFCVCGHEEFIQSGMPEVS